MTTSNGTSYYLENRIINTYLRGFQTSSSLVYVALYTVDPLESGSYGDVSGNGYKRLSASGVDPDTTGAGGSSGNPLPPPQQDPKFTVASGSASNNFLLTYPTATGVWGNISYIGLVSGAVPMTGSAIYFYGQPTSVINISNNDIYTIPIGAIKVFMLGSYSTYLANNILNQYLNWQSVYQPGLSVQVALFTTLPNADGNGGEEVPVYCGTNPTGYARKNVAGTSLWYSPTTGSTINMSAIDWGTAQCDWGLIEGAGIYESVHNNLLFRTYFNNKRQVLAGDGFKIGAGFMKVILD